MSGIDNISLERTKKKADMCSKLELLSIDLSNYCSKQCSFCYNHSNKEGSTLWKPEGVIRFASDCILHGVKAVSLGGGEPFEYDGIFDVIEALYPKCYLSITTNGLPLEDNGVWRNLICRKPDKIHITIHKPEDEKEIERIVRRLHFLEKEGIKSGLNMLVSADNVESAMNVYAQFIDIVTPEQIILIPQRYSNTPSPKQLARAAGGRPFQSPSCLLACQRPKDFASVSWDKKVSSCSYSPSKQPIASLDYRGLVEALENVEWNSCF